MSLTFPLIDQALALRTRREAMAIFQQVFGLVIPSAFRASLRLNSCVPGGGASCARLGRTVLVKYLLA